MDQGTDKSKASMVLTTEKSYYRQEYSGELSAEEEQQFDRIKHAFEAGESQDNLVAIHRGSSLASRADLEELFDPSNADDSAWKRFLINMATPGNSALYHISDDEGNHLSEEETNDDHPQTERPSMPRRSTSDIRITDKLAYEKNRLDLEWIERVEKFAKRTESLRRSADDLKKGTERCNSDLSTVLASYNGSTGGEPGDQ